MSKFISLAYNYWQLVDNSVIEMEKQKNTNIIITDYSDDIISEEKKFKELTKWNDQNIGIPILFNFYHGLELLMKGLLEFKSITVPKKEHNLRKLYEIIYHNKDLFSVELIDLFKKHIHNSNDYNPFFKANNIDVVKFYECFKYPVSNSELNFYYGVIRGKREQTIVIYQELRKATIDFYNAVVKWNCKNEDYNIYLKNY